MDRLSLVIVVVASFGCDGARTEAAPAPGRVVAVSAPETDPEEAREAAERIREMAESTIVQVGGAEVRATVSLGVAPRPATSEGVANWLSEADVALYEAKKYGRNRVIVGRARRPVVPGGPPQSEQPRALH